MNDNKNYDNFITGDQGEFTIMIIVSKTQWWWRWWLWLRWRWRWRCPSRWRNSTCCDILVPRPTGVSQGCKHLCQIKKGCQYSEWLLWQLCHNQIYNCECYLDIIVPSILCGITRLNLLEIQDKKKIFGTWWSV